VTVDQLFSALDELKPAFSADINTLGKYSFICCSLFCSYFPFWVVLCWQPVKIWVVVVALELLWCLVWACHKNVTSVHLASLLIQFWNHRLKGTLKCGARHAHILQSVHTYVEQLSRSQTNPLSTCLLEGPCGWYMHFSRCGPFITAWHGQVFHVTDRWNCWACSCFAQWSTMFWSTKDTVPSVAFSPCCNIC